MNPVQRGSLDVTTVCFVHSDFPEKTDSKVTPAAPQLDGAGVQHTLGGYLIGWFTVKCAVLVSWEWGTS